MVTYPQRDARVHYPALSVVAKSLNRYVMIYEYPESDPRHHAANVGRRLDELIEHLRGDLFKFDQPKGQALFEASAEVLEGLRTAFAHYESQSESAMRE
ncbi:MAG: hypothetical protein ABI680_20895 [Chthoniobacteraceae bacterium]